VTVLVVGDIATDVLTVYSGPLAVGSDTAAEVRITGGGSAANTAAWLVRAGVDSVLSGVVGDDDAGTARLAELREAGVRCAVRRLAGAGTGCVVVLSSRTERSMLCDRGANAALEPSDVDAGLPAAHLHLSSYSLFDPRSAPAGEHALRTARALGMTCSVDAGSAAPLARFGRARFLDLVRGADVLFANLDEARVLAGDADVIAALRPYSTMIVVKCGRDGAVLAERDGGEPISVPAQPAAVADPTGAGDAFAAGFLGAWLGGAGAAQALAAGARLGAQAVALVGGRPATRP
jgi:sugar/nucleoside kinase (ribokinase family)